MHACTAPLSSSRCAWCDATKRTGAHVLLPRGMATARILLPRTLWLLLAVLYLNIVILGMQRSAGKYRKTQCTLFIFLFFFCFCTAPLSSSRRVWCDATKRTGAHVLLPRGIATARILLPRTLWLLLAAVLYLNVVILVFIYTSYCCLTPYAAGLLPTPPLLVLFD